MRKFLFLLCCLGVASSAFAQERPANLSYEAALAQVRADPDCQFSAWPLYDIYYCEAHLTVWYFARPEHGGYPGYVQRRMETRDGATYMVTTGHSDGSDEQQPAFQAWMQQVGESLLRR